VPPAYDGDRTATTSPIISLLSRTTQHEVTTTLLLTCGLPGAGKTTLARRLAVERDAQRFTKDEWVRDLGGDLWDEQLRIRLEGELIELAFRLLAAGRSCILDFGLWSREERDALRLRARRLGVRVELHVLDVELAELVRRTAQRYADAAVTAPEICAEQLAEWACSFQAPSSAERRLFDAPPAVSQRSTAAAAPSR
jgi:predicted kinase